MITPECAGSLMNFKFRRAAEELTDEADARERAVVEALAIFGNPGHFLGGPMETIIFAAIQSILSDERLHEVLGVTLEYEDERTDQERLIDSLPDDWWTISDILMYLSAAGMPIESSTWGSYVTRGQAPPAERHFGRTGAWRPETIKKWQKSRPRQVQTG